jgi:hypothetical protein
MRRAGSGSTETVGVGPIHAHECYARADDRSSVRQRRLVVCRDEDHDDDGCHRDGTQLTRWLVLDITMPILMRPLRRLIIRNFDEESVRTMAAVKKYAEAHPRRIAGELYPVA